MFANKENDVKSNDDDEEGIRGFYIISSNKILNLKLPTQGRRCWGTPYGWLITMGLDLKINIFNPLSGVQLSLPPQPTFQHQLDSCSWPRRVCRIFIRKIALASNLCSTFPSTLDQGTVAMAIYGIRNYLAFASPRDKVWTCLDGPQQVQDIIFFNDHFYVVSFQGVLRVCELGTAHPSAVAIASLPDCCRNYPLYLIVLSGELHLVERITTCDDYDSCSDDDTVTIDDGDCGDPVEISSDNDTATVDDGDNDDDSDGDRVDGGQDDDRDEDPNKEEEEYESYTSDFHYDTKCFRVFRLNSMRTWSKVDDLGDHALFIGNNTSFAISTFQYPDFKSNCIYFTDDIYETFQYGHCDMGVYDMGKDSVSPFDISNDEPSKFSRPVFFMPIPL
ncbi:SWR1-complex protein 3 [Ranunculus cassubicifolius]